MEFIEERNSRVGKYIFGAFVFVIIDAVVFWFFLRDSDLGEVFAQAITNVVVLLVSGVILLQLWGVNLLFDVYRNPPPLRTISLNENSISIISGLVRQVIFFKDVMKLNFDKEGMPASVTLKDEEVIQLPRTANAAAFTRHLRAKLAHAL